MSEKDYTAGYISGRAKILAKISKRFHELSTMDVSEMSDMQYRIYAVVLGEYKRLLEDEEE